MKCVLNFKMQFQKDMCFLWKAIKISGGIFMTQLNI